jgi:hypothetical protein
MSTLVASIDVDNQERRRRQEQITKFLRTRKVRRSPPAAPPAAACHLASSPSPSLDLVSQIIFQLLNSRAKTNLENLH